MKSLAVILLAGICLLPSLLPGQTTDNPTPWNGTWTTKYGQLRLIQDGRRVYGDYHDAGYIEARTAATNPNILRGTFQRKDGQWGLFQFNLARNQRHFSGAWNYNTVPDANAEKWTGEKTTDIPGPIVNAVGKKLYWAKPYENRFPEDIAKWVSSSDTPPRPDPPKPTPMPNPLVDDRNPRPKPKPLENAVVRVRLYGIQGKFSRGLGNLGVWVSHDLSGSFYTNASLVDKNGNRTRLLEMNGVPEMIWKRDAHNPHKAFARDTRKKYVGGADPQKTNPPPAIVRSMAEWERKNDAVLDYFWNNLFDPALEVRFNVPLDELNHPDNQLRVQLSGFLFEVNARKKEEARGRAEVVWLFQKDPMKSSGDFKTMVWKPSRGDSGVEWFVHAAASFSYPGH
ncbi:hypothetical protein FEM03_21915 [Phragmitibacter flavus]|uniref:Uncharacterized protein n=1 Tax=Phragmitibacter flavus TaxID=2576071 RepID=A0A5R8K8B4_9BACT|nr:hypothetical protein [Phragmitibacter flavus]TLD68578.1 hypothetical protein FEM03_21915 [Phragmitibacter flavus]